MVMVVVLSKVWALRFLLDGLNRDNATAPFEVLLRSLNSTVQQASVPAGRMRAPRYGSVSASR
jgi:hypothetical protein